MADDAMPRRDCPRADRRKPRPDSGFLPSVCNVAPEPDLPKIRGFVPLAQHAVQGFQQAIDIGIAVVMRDADADDAVIRVEPNR